MSFTDNLLQLIKCSDELYKNLLTRAGHCGMELSRSGGSQGLCSFNKLMRKHLSNPGTFPRHANGMLIIIVNSKNRCGYFGIYSCPYDVNGSMKVWFYNTPQVGGHQRLLHDQLLKFPVLTKFPACRVETAAILQYRNYMLPYRKACPCAADNILGEWYEGIEKRKQDVKNWMLASIWLRVVD